MDESKDMSELSKTLWEMRERAIAGGMEIEPIEQIMAEIRPRPEYYEALMRIVGMGGRPTYTGEEVARHGAYDECAEIAWKAIHGDAPLPWKPLR